MENTTLDNPLITGTNVNPLMTHARPNRPSAELYRATLVPALQKIQHEHLGYLDHAALKDYSERASVPLYRLQAVASFFPHFHLSPPKKVTVRVCRDMACHMAGSQEMLTALQARLEGWTGRRRGRFLPGTLRPRAGRLRFHRRGA